MKTSIIAVIVGVLMLGASGVSQQRDVIVPPHGFSQDRVQSSGRVGSYPHSPIAVPPDDFNKWQVTVFHNGGSVAKRLTSDLRAHPELSKLSTWGHLNFYDVRDPDSARRFAGYEVDPAGKMWRKDNAYVLVHPTKGGPYPYVSVYREEGYDGNPVRLYSDVQRMVEEFRKRYDKQATAASRRLVGRSGNMPCPSPDPTPYDPLPYPDDNIPPLTPIGPIPEPNLPVIPPIIPPVNPDIPMPTPDVPIGPITPDVLPDNDPNRPPRLGEYPEWPQVTLIIDHDSMFEGQPTEMLIHFARHIAEQTSLGFLPTKARYFDLRDAGAKAFPTGPGDTPVIYLTQGRMLHDTLRGSTLKMLFRAYVGKQPSQWKTELPWLRDAPGWSGADNKQEPGDKPTPPPSGQPQITPPRKPDCCPADASGTWIQQNAAALAAVVRPHIAVDVQAAMTDYFAAHPLPPGQSKDQIEAIIAAWVAARPTELAKQIQPHLPPIYFREFDLTTGKPRNTEAVRLGEGYEFFTTPGGQ